MIKYLSILLLLLVPLISHAREFYAHPAGSGPAGTTGCSFESPCLFSTALNAAVGGDTVWLKNGTYNFEDTGTVKAGSAGGGHITIAALNRHQAIFNYTGPHKGCGATENACGFEMRHSWTILRGVVINGNSKLWNGFRLMGAQAVGVSGARLITNVLVEDIYMHHAGNTTLWCGMTGDNVEVRNSTFDEVGHADDNGDIYGSANYFGSSTEFLRPCKIKDHHNIFSKHNANAVDFKGDQRDAEVYNNIFMDHKARAWDGSTGDGQFTTGNPKGTGLSTATNRVSENIIYRPLSSVIFNFNEAQKLVANGNVIVNYLGPPSGSRQLNTNSADWPSYSLSYNNLHCPSQGVSAGTSHHGSNPANQVNRPQAECDDRIRQIVGVPEIAGCNIGNINDNTITVDIDTLKNGPVYPQIGNLQVTYNGVAQTGEVTTLPSSNQARIAVQTPPANDDVVVRVVVAEGDIKNSAFIGGKTCGNRDNYGLTTYTRGQGFCGESDASDFICTNTVTGGGPPPPSEALTQAVWRFYQAHTVEGASPLAPEDTQITGRFGGKFRLRIGVRGGGSNAPSRSYALAASVCNPTCSVWREVSNAGDVGVIFLDDDAITHGSATTNQLSLGGKTFLAGHFIEQPVSTPATALTTTQQIEWEFALQIPADNLAVQVGDTIQFRIQHNDGTALSSYSLPSMIMGVGGGGSITGSITGKYQ